jgi:ribonuclease VapC
MIVDTSALMAILLDEGDGEDFAMRILRADARAMATPTLVETMIVAISRFGPGGRDRVNELIEALGIEVVPFDPDHARLAADASLAFGKGRHPAALNFGDCCAHALAKATGRPLLFKGDDFARTDIPSALA